MIGWECGTIFSANQGARLLQNESNCESFVNIKNYSVSKEKKNLGQKMLIFNSRNDFFELVIC